MLSATTCPVERRQSEEKEDGGQQEMSRKEAGEESLGKQEGNVENSTIKPRKDQSSVLSRKAKVGTVCWL